MNLIEKIKNLTEPHEVRFWGTPKLRKHSAGGF
jgi:hypothetical protein